MNTKLRSIFALTILALLMLTATGAMAQSSTVRSRTNEFEITGIATALNATHVTVNGRVIDISRAEFNGAIGVGVVVKVHYSIAANGLLVAREIEPALAGNNPGGDVDDDGANHDVNDDHGGDGANHDVNDDHGDDGANHDVNDDHGDDGVNHDVNDDHGGDDNNDDRSGRGSGGSDDSSGHGGRGGDNSGRGRGGRDD